MKKLHSMLAVLVGSAVLFCSASEAMPAANGMHYGNPATESNAWNSIVITNCTNDTDNVYAWFSSDGSSNSMPIYPNYQYPRNIISIDNVYPPNYINLQITASDGTILYPLQSVYPRQNVGIGCDRSTSTTHPSVVVTPRF